MRIVVIRTSAMGDAALAAPVLNALRNQHPEVETILVTRKLYNAFFRQDRSLIIFNPEFSGRHKGLKGILRLFRDLTEIGKIDHVIDIHDVLRTKLLVLLFRMKGIKVSVIDKGRKEKRQLVGGEKKALKHSVQRYADTFSHAGIELHIGNEKPIKVTAIADEIAAKVLGDSAVRNIGLAPFAKHKLKMWPEDYMVELTRHIARDFNVRFLLFGGPEEKERIASLCQKIPGSLNLCDKLTLEEELAVMSRLDLMIAMDSSNMHMAALTGTKVVSVWGATDPMAGFGAWLQPDEYSIRVPADELTCRPCTIFGQGSCKRSDFACMLWLNPEIVYNNIRKLNIL
ncbi:MAG TPA: glycosyltransferase family 9 protein [Bacteroidales bacterium]|nr:glycosyltransferase family 9 protein [Bacteroidales bacterium]